MSTLKIFSGLICIVALAIAGCSDVAPDSDATRNPVTPGPTPDQHDHGHAHGPKGGELFEIPAAGIKGEWVPKYGQDLIIFYIYEQDGKTEMPIKAEKLVGSFKIQEVETFDIPAVGVDEGMASKFEIVDEKLALAMKTSGITLTVDIDGQTHTVELEKDPHH